jgi:hypothetical protein
VVALAAAADVLWLRSRKNRAALRPAPAKESEVVA